MLIIRVCVLGPGNSTHTERWVRAIEERGHSVRLLSLHPIQIAGINGVQIGGQGMLGKWSYAWALPRLRREIRAFGPDILHAFRVSSYGVLATLSGFHPLVISVWGEDVYKAPRNPIVAGAIRLGLRRAELICTTGDHLAQVTRQFAPPNTDIRVIPFGIRLGSFSPKVESTVQSEMITIGTIRHLRPNYGIQYLIQAFARLSEEIRTIRLVIGGDGPYRSTLEDLVDKLGIRSQVKFLGAVPNSQVPSILESIDIFAMPSLYESFGVAALEAQAMRIPVVASAVGGLWETVQDGGVLVPPADVDELAAALRRLIIDPGLRRSLGQDGRRFVEQRYDWDCCVDQLENSYASLLQFRSGG